MEVYAYQPNPAEYRWVMGEEMIGLLSEGKGMVTIDPNSGKPMIHEWLVDVENDNQHPYWIYFLGRDKFVLKIEKMKEIILGNITLYNADCMDIMRGMADNSFDLAIVDPPYGINKDRPRGAGVLGPKSCYATKNWDRETPSDEYFNELRRVSKNQIIWGANYFMDKIAARSSCWVVWDKQNGKNDFADCELAYTSFNSAARLFVFKWQGMLQGDMKHKEKRIHPTQKPVALYKWLLTNYAKPGNKILDTHLGSGSICIACDDLGFEMTGIELDHDYYEAAKNRLIVHQMQQKLFNEYQV